MLALGLLLLAGQVESAAPAAQASRAPREGEPAPRVCSTIQVTSAEAATRSKVATFSATKVLDLEIGALMNRKLTGDHLLELKVFTPRGHLYQSFAVPFSGAATRAASAPRLRQVDGYPQPLPEQPVRTVRDAGQVRYLVSTRLPVAGTSIMTSSLYGAWRAEAYLDGGLKPCGPAKTFTINP
jgi:hypothetical protein